MQSFEKECEELLQTHPHLKDVLTFLDIHHEESHRGSVLVACSFLEEQLRIIIDSYLVENSDKNTLLSGFNAPIGSFSARIITAHCLGLISDNERDDCTLIRKVRNKFAHNYKISFKDESLISLCNKLHHSAKDYDEVIIDTYSKFSTAAIGLILHFSNRAYHVSNCRLEKREWPSP